MRRVLLVLATLGIVIIAGNPPTARAALGSIVVGDGGQTLPACGPTLFGAVFYAAGRYWKCVDGNPDRWVT